MKKGLLKNAKATNSLAYALSSNEFNQMWNCEKAMKKIGSFRGYTQRHKSSQRVKN